MLAIIPRNSKCNLWNWFGRANMCEWWLKIHYAQSVKHGEDRIEAKTGERERKGESAEGKKEVWLKQRSRIVWAKTWQQTSLKHAERIQIERMKQNSSITRWHNNYTWRERCPARAMKKLGWICLAIIANYQYTTPKSTTVVAHKDVISCLAKEKRWSKTIHN